VISKFDEFIIDNFEFHFGKKNQAVLRYVDKQDIFVRKNKLRLSIILEKNSFYSRTAQIRLFTLGLYLPFDIYKIPLYSRFGFIGFFFCLQKV
jgi:hypothetical protein